jgi:hypothetical protein
MSNPHKLTKLSLTIVSILSLSACIEVEDDSNNELTAAVQQQNQILTEQLNQAQQTNTVSISGLVVNLGTNLAADNVLLTVKTPTETIIEDEALTDGTFTVNGLPSDSAIEMVVSSSDDSFLPRVFYRNTGSSTSGEAQKDFGKFGVSEGKEYSIEVLNSVTNLPIEDLVFRANSNSGTGASEDNYLHISNFDEVNGLYTITLPANLDLLVSASIDADRDGRRDFIVENNQLVSGTNLRVNSFSIEDIGTIRLQDVTDVVLDQVEFRISVVDDAGAVLTEASVITSNSNSEISSGFDADSQQYVVNTEFERFVNLELPAFSENDISYQSASISVSEQDENTYSIRISNTATFSSFLVEKSEVINLALSPRVNSSSNTQLEVLLQNDPAKSEMNALTLFYTQSVELDENAVNLFDADAINVIQGNADANDTVLPGTTEISFGRNIEITTATALNGTKLVATPTVELRGDARYVYSVGTLTATDSGIRTDISGDDNISFNTEIRVSDTAFTIDDLVVDNFNYTTNGSAIVTENTAGVPSTVTDQNNSVYLVLPESINQLQTLTLSKTQYVNDGTTVTDSDEFRIVRNGVIQVEKIALVSLARNENIQRSGFNVSLAHSSALPDSERYRLRTFDFLSDNTGANTNSVSFNYVLETKAGEVSTGTVTLPVL